MIRVRRLRDRRIIFVYEFNPAIHEPYPSEDAAEPVSATEEKGEPSSLSSPSVDYGSHPVQNVLPMITEADSTELERIGAAERSRPTGPRQTVIAALDRRLRRLEGDS